MSISSILIANRGEIAVRIIRAAKELGIRTVQVHSSADVDSLAVKMADVRVEIGPPQAAKSYLNVEAILDAAKKHNVDAIHPGYGFLSENSNFARAVTESNIIFIGPDGSVIERMGDKVAARQAAESAGVPTVPGSSGRIDDMDQARKLVEQIGFPIMIKAAAGGGGRGIRVVNDLQAFEKQAPEARTEAQAAFGDGGLYIEKLIAKSRHIEVQILADGNRAVHLFDRDCSLQRRRQKVWEEAPSATLDKSARDRLCQSAVQLAESVGYKGAGTVEYLYDDQTGEFYFIEMNTRIQVEHPVSEMITGLDLIREMIEIAAGKPLQIQQQDIEILGHAIEVRINAEDPSKDFLPFPGQIKSVNLPGGAGVRFDGMIYSGYAIPPFYDSLLGKLIVWDSDRSLALSRLRRSLSELEIEGVCTTTPLFEALAADKDVQKGTFDTKWLEKWLESNSSTLGK